MAPIHALAVGLLLLLSHTLTAFEPTLTVVWSDSHRLFPEAGIGVLRDELQQLFRANGISVQLHVFRVGEELRDIPEPRIQAIVTPSTGSSYSLPRDAMGATIGERGGTRNVFVFFPGLARTLGHVGESFTPREILELARAMARVLAHELVHVLAPERGHAETGLMSEQLKRKDLVRRTIGFDGASVRLARSNLLRWADREAAVAAASRRRVTPVTEEAPPAGLPLQVPNLLDPSRAHRLTWFAEVSSPCCSRFDGCPCS